MQITSSRKSKNASDYLCRTSIGCFQLAETLRPDEPDTGFHHACGDGHFPQPQSAADGDGISGTIAADGTLALPGSNYLDLKHAYINANPYSTLLRQSPRYIYDHYSTRTATSRPRYIAREGSSFIFGPYPDSQYAVGGVYYQNLGPLSTSAHAAFTNNPDVYLFGSLLQAVRTLKDDAGIQRWQPLYQEALLSANGLTNRENWSGSDLAVSSA